MTGRRRARSAPSGFLSGAVAVLLALWPWAGPAPAAPPRLAGAPPRATTWVFFRDHGFPDAAAESRAIQDLAEVSSGGPRSARAGRRPDHRDLPVCPRYLAELQSCGARIRHLTRWLNGVSVEIDADRLPEVGALPFVRSLEPVRRSRHPVPAPPGPDGLLLDAGLDAGRAALDPAGARSEAGGDERLRLSPPLVSTAPSPLAAGDEALFYGPSINQNLQIGIVDLHRRGYTGAGVTVAIFDSGFRTGHPALAGRHLVAQHDFVFGDGVVDNQPNDVSNAWNHGTSVWSNAGGYAPGALIGGGYEASILLAKTEDVRSETPIEEDNYVAALEWADALGADIVTASLVYLDFDGSGGDYTYAQLDGNTTVTARAVDIAVSRGICVVNAAGNEGPLPGSIWTPADADSVLSVGAVDSNSVVASFSSRGPTADGQIKPEVVARGVRNYVASATTLAYGPANGTSFATPMVAGAAALLKEAHPEWSGFQIREALRQTASHPLLPDNNSGYGLLNVRAAADLAPTAPAAFTRPFALLEPARGSTVGTAAPLFRWEGSRSDQPADQVTYRVVLSTTATFALADTFSAESDTTWLPPAFLTPGATFYWTVLATNLAGRTRPALFKSWFTVSSAAGVAENEAPAVTPGLGAPWPNPSNGLTHVEITLPPRATGFFAGVPNAGAAPVMASTWTLDVLSVDGRLRRRVGRGAWPVEGWRGSVSWDGRDDRGRSLPAGVYFVRLMADDRQQVERIIRSGPR